MHMAEKSMITERLRAAPTRPMTGGEYVESLRDGRDVYIYGERVKDVTTHPAFRNSVRMTARLYDALHAPETRDILTSRRLTSPVRKISAACKCGWARSWLGAT